MGVDLWFLSLLFSAGLVSAQMEDSSCPGSGSITLAVILTLILGGIIVAAALFLWGKYKARKDHLILETDPEKGKGEYAFDNPGFKDTSILPITTKSTEKNSKVEATKPKWNQWSPLAALTTKSEKRKTLDDTAIEGGEVKVVELRSHDFTGLGFNICGNMKEGIYIKDILHRGPAFESGKLNAGDRINSVTISFEHMVYEDALTILSYASPYEVIIEARSGKILHNTQGQGAHPSHPVYRSSSCTDLFHIDKSAKKRLFGDDYTGSISSNYSSLQKSRSNMTTLERKESKSPKSNNLKTKKHHKHLTSDQLKLQLEQKINPENFQKNKEKPIKTDNEVQKTDNKYQKFGIRVLPENQQKSPKHAELSQNDNNLNLEKNQDFKGIDEVDETVKAPQAKKREKKPEDASEFSRGDNNGSGIRRDKNGIPQEIPSHMMNAAVAARRNRKSSVESVEREDDEKTPKKKGKAPAPPREEKDDMKFDEIQPFTDDMKIPEDEKQEEYQYSKSRDETVYNSDSDVETDNQSSVNTIELNSSDITIHQAEEEEKQNRKTASTGDLTKIQKTRKSSTGTLERAQSLDITDTGIPSLKRKGTRIDDELMKSDEDLFGKTMLSKEPRLSLILDGLNTFQRNRLKKSTEWGNLEDAILKLNQEEDIPMFEEPVSTENLKFNFGEKSPEFDALVNKINEIKRESMEDTVPVPKPEKKIKNQIWPTELEPATNGLDKNIVLNGKSPEKELKSYEKRQQYPASTESLNYPPVSIDEEVMPEIIDTIETNNSNKRQTVPTISEVKIKQTEKVPKVPEKELIQVKVPEIKTGSEQNSPTKVDTIQISPSKIPVLSSNNTDESKTIVIGRDHLTNLKDLTQNFLFTEQINCSEDDYAYVAKMEDTNISDDIKVSRHSYGSLERQKEETKSDDAKSRQSNVSNVTVNNKKSENGDSDLHSLELSINEPNEMYTTALESSLDSPNSDNTRVTISTPDLIKNVTLTEAISTVNNDVTIRGPSSITLEMPNEKVEVTESKFSTITSDPNDSKDSDSSNKTNSTLTYITEIQVMTPNANSNISAIEIVPTAEALDSGFENYVKNFEANVKNFETNINDYEANLEEFMNKEPKSIVITEGNDPAQELHKIQEIAEEQLKKLPEMRFTTSSYEASRIPEKRQSQIEMLRSNFEKSPPKASKTETTPKSRIPIATTAKTPPMSPERRDSKVIDVEQDKAILELMSGVHSTPMTSKYQVKSPSKNVTVTSIRSNSKIPSGISFNSRPPIPPRKLENSNENTVQISTNGNVESSFKQWVFNPSSNSITNITLNENKQDQK